MGHRIAAMVLYGLLSSQILFGAAAVVSAVMKDGGAPAGPVLHAAGETTVQVR